MNRTAQIVEKIFEKTNQKHQKCEKHIEWWLSNEQTEKKIKNIFEKYNRIWKNSNTFRPLHFGTNLNKYPKSWTTIRTNKQNRTNFRTKQRCPHFCVCRSNFNWNCSRRRSLKSDFAIFEPFRLHVVQGQENLYIYFLDVCLLLFLINNTYLN